MCLHIRIYFFFFKWSYILPFKLDIKCDLNRLQNYSLKIFGWDNYGLEQLMG